MNHVYMNAAELCWYHRHGQVRHGRVGAMRLRAEYGEDNARQRNHVMGAGGEYAVALHLGIVWPTDIGPDHHQPDVGGYHVRTTEYDHGGLILRGCDPDGPWVLVVRFTPVHFGIVGCIDTTTIDRGNYLRRLDARRPPAVVIPQHAIAS